MKVKKLFYLGSILMGLTILFSCSFNPNIPSVVEISVQDGERIKDVDSFREIEISFDKPMSRYITEKNISISGYYGVIIFEWFNQDRGVKLFLKDGLKKGVKYNLLISRESESKEGVNLKRDFSCIFYTYKIEDEFYVVSTYPEEGEEAARKNVDGDVVFLTRDGKEVSGLSDLFYIKIDFSLPIEITTIYDKVSAEPSFLYTYFFENNRKTLILKPVHALDINKIYKIRLSEELCAQNGKHLKEDYQFTFNTVVSEDSFSIIYARMENQENKINLNIGNYLGCTSGIEKDMSLFVGFNSDFFVYSMENLIYIEPPIIYHIYKEDGINPVLIFNFDEDMVQEEIYRITFDRSITNVFGVSMDTDYTFEWVVDGEKSCFLDVKQVEIIDPLGMNNTVVFQDGILYQNRDMLFRTEGEEKIVGIKVLFSSKPDVYASLNGFNLNYVFGNIEARDGNLINYKSEEQSNSLQIEFSVPVLFEGGDAAYKFIISGGSDGIMDIFSNPLKDDFEVYMIYPVPE